MFEKFEMSLLQTFDLRFSWSRGAMTADMIVLIVTLNLILKLHLSFSNNSKYFQQRTKLFFLDTTYLEVWRQYVYRKGK